MIHVIFQIIIQNVQSSEGLFSFLGFLKLLITVSAHSTMVFLQRFYLQSGEYSVIKLHNISLDDLKTFQIKHQQN